MPSRVSLPSPRTVPYRYPHRNRPYLLALPILLILSASAFPDDPNPRVALGERLFREMRFDNPAGDLDIGCVTCHTPADGVGFRGFADPLGRSWQPWRREDPARETLRNAPGLFDLEDHEFIHTDGEFLSLEAQSERTLTGRNFGWLPKEKDIAARNAARLLREHYTDAFQRAYAIDLAAAEDDECVRAAARAISDFVRSLRSARTSPYDEFLRANGLNDSPQTGESPEAYGKRVLDELDDRAARGTIVPVEGFGEMALEGYRIFLRTEGTERAGNCVACHVPPTFTDRGFHNTGVSQMEYDAAHGAGAFADLAIPTTRTQALPQFMKPVRHGRPGEVDLGYWNFARYGNSPMYVPQEAEPDFRIRTIATFKTPPLRNLPSTPPYMHNGLYTTLEAALHQKVEAAFLARMGDLRNPDPELMSIRIMEHDFEALVAFLNALCDPGTRTAEFTGLPGGDAVVAPNSSYSYRPDELDTVGEDQAQRALDLPE